MGINEQIARDLIYLEMCIGCPKCHECEEDSVICEKYVDEFMRMINNDGDGND